MTPHVAAAAAVGCCGQHRSHISSLVGGRGPWDRPTPRKFCRVLSARFRVADIDGAAQTTKLRKGGGIHAFLGRLTSEAAPVPILVALTLLKVDWDGEAHIIHSLFSVPVGPYDPYHQLFGCRGELPPEGLPAITDIPVASFLARRGISAVPLDNHIVHMEGVSPSS